MNLDEALRVSAARALQELIRRTRGCGHVHVRMGTGYLTIEAEGADGARMILARAIPTGTGEYRMSLLAAPRIWDHIPGSGPLEEIAERIVELVGSSVRTGQDERHFAADPSGSKPRTS